MKKKYRTLQPVLDVHGLNEPHDFNDYYNGSPTGTVLEIGFGTGEYIVRQAREHTDRHYIGVEKNISRIYKTINKIVDQRLANVHLVDCDAIFFLKRFVPNQFLDQVVCLFPCPWPKKGQVKNRLFSRDFFSLLNARLTDTGKALLVTDYQPYAEWVQEQINDELFDCVYSDVAPQFDTKFERKWELGGQQSFYQFEFKKKKHVSFPIEKGVEMKVYFADQCQLDGLVGKEVSEDNFHIKFLDMVVDQSGDKSLVLVVVSEENMMQHCWIEVARCRKGWRVGVARGSNVFATASVARAVSFVHEFMNQK